MSNRITAYFKGRIGVAESVYQNDSGLIMVFDSIDLPAHFDCYFSRLNQEESFPGVGADNMVAIPNDILANPGNITVHIPLHTSANDSEVEYIVYFKIIGRARPMDDGTPAQMTAIERALALLSQPITNIEEIVNEALSFTGDTFAEMKQELADDFAEYKGDVDDDIADFKTEIRGDIADVEHDFDILDGQFQTAVAAITVDSEVQGIRTGDDGKTYTSAGEAVRKQFSDVKNILKIIDREIYNATTQALTVGTSGVALNAGGYATSKTGYYASAFIPIGENKLFAPDFNMGAVDVNCIAVGFYSASNFGTLVESLTNIEANQIYVIPDTAQYMAFTAEDGVTSSVAFLESKIPELEEAQNIVNDIVASFPDPRQLYDDSNPNIFNGYSNGLNFISSSAHRILYIPCKPFTKYTISGSASLWLSRGVYTSAQIPANNGAVSVYTGAETHTENNREYVTLTTDSNAQYICVMYYNSNATQAGTEAQVRATIMIAEGQERTAYYSYTSVNQIKESALPDSISGALIYERNIIRKAATLNNGEKIEFGTPNIKKNNLLTFSANVSSFGSLTIGQGRTAINQTAYIVIDSSTVKVYRYTTQPVEWISLNHGLTIQDYIDVTIAVSNDEIGWAKLMVTSNGETYTYNRMAWLGCGNVAYAEVSGGSLKNAVLQHSCTDYAKEFWLLGDSYFDHWCTYALADGFKNYLCDGYSGRNSAQAIASLDKLLQHGKPKHLVWCMGMNDGDSSSAISSAWLTAYNNLVAICDDNDIDLILCTIPNTPTVNNSFKNAYIRSSGYSFIDLAEAVGSEDNASWYSGLLSNDNVHPSTTGDKVIAKFMETAIPQIFG